MSDKLISVGVVAERLSVSPRTIWKGCASGRLPAPVRIGRSVRWRESDLDRFIELDCDMRRFEADREGVPVTTAIAGGTKKAERTVSYDHPYRQQLIADPDFFIRRWRGYRLERDPELRRRVTGRDILDLRDEIEGLRNQLEGFTSRTADGSKPEALPIRQDPLGGVTVPGNVRRSIHRRVRR